MTCEVCKGKRYNREALEIHFKGRSIADVLEMTIAEANEFFSAVPNVAVKLQTLYDVGLGLRPSRPARDDAVGRRGAAGQARDRAVAAGDRPDAVRPRRADDRAPLRRRREAARGPPPPRRRRQHGARDRAQPRRDQDGRLDRRPGPGGRRPRRPDHRRGHARSRSPPRRAPRPASTWPGCSAASRSCRCRTSRSPRRRVAAATARTATGRPSGSRRAGSARRRRPPASRAGPRPRLAPPAPTPRRALPRPRLCRPRPGRAWCTRGAHRPDMRHLHVISAALVPPGCQTSPNAPDLTRVPEESRSVGILGCTKRGDGQERHRRAGRAGPG